MKNKLEKATIRALTERNKSLLDLFLWIDKKRQKEYVGITYLKGDMK